MIMIMGLHRCTHCGAVTVWQKSHLRLAPRRPHRGGRTGNARRAQAQRAAERKALGSRGDFAEYSSITGENLFRFKDASCCKPSYTVACKDGIQENDWAIGEDSTKK